MCLYKSLPATLSRMSGAAEAARRMTRLFIHEDDAYVRGYFQ
jgi:hypothetical protein